ncbi:sodium:solute symporter family transporter [Blastopirellula marina]|uniref:Sodium:solute symporter n=1 Tax=Blastopirellula marina TaxID=124 RepID=A0A2S8GIH5_9BACT|nr:hypothetical protein [Blastopirellula marina]PQO44245.1 hypothetical protein C5Y93_19985 [Blastopirellula marina]
MPNLFESAQLDWLDWGVLALYFGGLILLGVVLRKQSGDDLEGYFLAGRKVPGWLNGFSYAATCMNADVAPAYCGMTVVTGAFICWFYFARFGLALMIAAVLFAGLWRRLKLRTSPEFYELRFSGGPALTMRSWVALRSALIAMTAWTGAGLLGLHKIASPLLGWSIFTTLAIVIPVILFYVLASGYVGVVTSDFFQTLIIIGSSVLLMAIVLIDFGGPTQLFTALEQTAGPEAASVFPPLGHEVLGFIAIAAWTIGTTIGYGGDAAPMAGAMEGQRILSCRNERESAKMYVWTTVVLFLLLATLTLPALAAMVHWPEVRTPEQKELAYGMLLARYLPPGLLGLALSAVLASIMSTVSSNMNFGAQVLVNDVYQRSLVKEASTRHYLMMGRIFSAGILILGVLVAVAATNVIQISIFMLGLSSAELTANWAQWWWWRFNGWARLTASLGGPLIFVLNKLFLFPNPWFSFPHLLDFGPHNDYMIIFVSMGMTLIAWVTVALLTKPEPMPHLIAFYRRARPYGFWRPVAEAAGEPLPPKGRIAFGFAVAPFGTIMAAAAILALSLLYLGRWDGAAVALGTMLLAGTVFYFGFSKLLQPLRTEDPIEDAESPPADSLETQLVEN